ncbi:uncharacterized protein LOC123411117 [Hordeum vulgare subsp. vulgare]|nr:uncharacterized protein LOC123411117 [Hordeum vulgare subsp. vulgare]
MLTSKLPIYMRERESDVQQGGVGTTPSSSWTLRHHFATEMATVPPRGISHDEIVVDVVPAVDPPPPGPGIKSAPPPPGHEIKSDPAPKGPEIKSAELMRDLSKYILLLATLVATVTYAAGFNPPGGVWQDTDDAAGRLAGDSIIRTTSYRRYLVFYYCNATAFASSLVVIVLVLFLALLRERNTWISMRPLLAVMVLDLVSVMGAYAAGTCRDKLTTIYSLVLVGLVVLYLVGQMALASFWSDKYFYSSDDPTGDKRLRKVLMLLATFAVSVTYIAGMSTPGGFWDDPESGHRPGDAILKDSHGKRLTTFLCFNAMAFVASLLIIVVLLDRKPRLNEAYGCIAIALISLVGAYTAGSCRETDTTIYVISLVGAVIAFIIFLRAVIYFKENVPVVGKFMRDTRATCFWAKIEDLHDSVSGRLPVPRTPSLRTINSRKAADKASSLVLLLATLAAAITYQAGLDPPGGVWQDNGQGHMAGDPILLTANPRRYKAFFYCNSVAFVASLVAIILVQNKLLLETHVLEAAMILDLFGLIGAYAAGSCRDVSTSIYAMALAGGVLVYVVIHVVFFTLDHTDTITPQEIEMVEKRRKRLLLFAVLAATVTYQAGLTPPGGFRLHDDGSSGYQAGDPVLLNNFPRRYTAYFYCNSVSFMLSIALIILLVNPHLYRPAIRSYALAICTAVGMFGLMGAYAAGSTQHLKTSIYIFALVVVVLLVIAALFLLFLRKNRNGDTSSQPKPETSDDEEKTKYAKQKYLMLLGILVASVTYQAGLDPPGGAWQHSSEWYDAGNPVMHDNRRPRYLAFFYSNSTSFVASIVVIIILLLEWKNKKKWSLRVLSTTIVLDLLALLVAYAAGSSRGWKTSAYVIALIIAVLAYIAIHVILAFLCSHHDDSSQPSENPPIQERGNGGNPA